MAPEWVYQVTLMSPYIVGAPPCLDVGNRNLKCPGLKVTYVTAVILALSLIASLQLSVASCSFPKLEYCHANTSIYAYPRS